MATTTSGTAAQIAARVLQQPVTTPADNPVEYDDRRQPLSYSTSNRQPATQSTFYNSSDVSRAISNPKSYAARVQTKPGLAIATSAPGGEDDLMLSPTSTADLDYQDGRGPVVAASSRPRTLSVTDQSPLQQLEGHFGSLSKEEKRARAEEAEKAARQRGAEKISRRPVEKPLPVPRRTNQQGQEPSLAPAYSTAPDKTHSRNISSSSDHAAGTNATYSSTGQPPSPTEPFSRSKSQRSGHDSALTGGAAAAALGAFQAAREQKPLPALPGRSTSGRAPTRDISQSSGPPQEPATAQNYSQASHAPTTMYENEPSVTQAQASDAQYENVRNTSQVQEAVPTQIGNDAHKAAKSQLRSDQHSKTYNNTAAVQAQERDPIPPAEVRAKGKTGPNYEISPQTAAGVGARQQVGFGGQDPNRAAPAAHDASRLHRFLHRDRGQVSQSHGPAGLDEWKDAQTAELLSEDVNSDAESDDQAWWERRGGKGAQSQQQNAPAFGAPYDGGYEAGQDQTTFTPKLFLKCGPLLRYTGIKVVSQESKQPGSVVWTGSVMIVTEDTKSSYETAPTLQLFKQSKEVLPMPSKEIRLDDGRVVPEYFDALAGEPKVARNGMTLFVKPVDQVKPETDLSTTESDDGLFTRNHPLPRGQSSTRQKKRKGGRIREVQGFKLLTERGVTFWRFNLKVHLRSKETRIAYRINNGPLVGFWVPALDQPMNVMFHSCNGFSLSVNANEFSGPDPLWRDVMNRHQYRPFHAMIGGGDQIYNDAAMRNTTLFQEWLEIKNPEHKHSAKFTPEMQAELEIFYLNRYAMWFSQGIFGMANSQIPMVNIWDDHDIMDGFGSYPHHFMSTPVFSGVGAVAFKYYMLFQHQSVPAENEESESSWLLGASPGPYINELSRSVFLSLGKGIAFLGLDCRTERMRDEILSEQTYDRVFDRCEREIIKGKTKHLIVLLGVPIAYPRLNFLENILTSRLMDPIKAIGRTGILGGFVNKFDGGVEILDDLDDHWTAKHHKHERNWLIQELQFLAATKSVRVTILGGDVHLAAVGQFYSNKKLGIPKDRDHRYMPNVVSSAIVNTPPPPMMGDILNKRNKIHHLDKETDEDMIPLFPHDVDGKTRNNLHLLPRRNWCSITPFQPNNPAAAMLTVPAPAPAEQARPSSRRSFSLTRRNSTDGTKSSIFRRFSTRKAPPSSFKSPNAGQLDPRNIGERASMDAQRVSMDDQSVQSSSGPERTNSFLRRPTSSYENRGSSQPAEINLEGGLEICINVEIDQKDPAGITQPYSLLVPALFYGGPADPNTASAKSRMDNFFGTLRRRNTQKRDMDTQGYANQGNQMYPPAPPAKTEVNNGIPMVEHAQQQDGEYSDNDNDEFHDAHDGAPLPMVVSNTPPVPQSRAVSNAMTQESATNGTVIPDSSYRQPASQTAHARSPSAEWGGLGGASKTSRQASTKSRVTSDPSTQQSTSQARGTSSSYTTPLQTSTSSAFNGHSERSSMAMPGPLTANPPTPSNANFGTSEDRQTKYASGQPDEKTVPPLPQSLQQSMPRVRASADTSKSNRESDSQMSEPHILSGALGPAPPANIDQLPDAIKKRYSQYKRAPGSSDGPARSKSYGSGTNPPANTRTSADAGPWPNQRSFSQNAPPQSNGAYPPQNMPSRNGPMQADSTASQPWTSQSKQPQSVPAQQSQSYQSQQPYSQTSSLRTNGHPQAPKMPTNVAPPANWQAPSAPYKRPQTPPRDSRAMFHDEDALNELLGTSNQPAPTSKRTSGINQAKKPEATNTLPPQQAPFPFPASQLQSEIIQPHSHTQPASRGGPSAAPQPHPNPPMPTASLPPAAPTPPATNTTAANITASTKPRSAPYPAPPAAPAAASYPQDPPQNHTAYLDTSSTSSLSMPPSKPELFLQSRVPSSQQRDAAGAAGTRSSKLDRMFGGGDGAMDASGGRGGSGRSGGGGGDGDGGYGGYAAPGARYAGDAGERVQTASGQKEGFVGKVMRRLSEGGSGRKGSASGEGGQDRDRGWRSWR